MTTDGWICVSTQEKQRWGIHSAVRNQRKSRIMRISFPFAVLPYNTRFNIRKSVYGHGRGRSICLRAGGKRGQARWYELADLEIISGRGWAQSGMAVRPHQDPRKSRHSMEKMFNFCGSDQTFENHGSGWVMNLAGCLDSAKITRGYLMSNIYVYRGAITTWSPPGPRNLPSMQTESVYVQCLYMRKNSIDFQAISLTETAIFDPMPCYRLFIGAIYSFALLYSSIDD